MSDEGGARPLWAPWRIEYILSQKGGDCVFCLDAAITDEELAARHVVHMGERACVMLNKYPFASGHLLVIPYEHVSNLSDLDGDTHDQLFRLVRESAARLERAVKPQGLNIGMNLGASAGAGIAEHLHVHIVPRWAGDTNFMPVLADTRVVPQALEATRKHLLSYFADLPRGRPAEGAISRGA